MAPTPSVTSSSRTADASRNARERAVCTTAIVAPSRTTGRLNSRTVPCGSDTVLYCSLPAAIASRAAGSSGSPGISGTFRIVLIAAGTRTRPSITGRT